MKEILHDDGSAEVVLYDPESEKVQLWEAVKDDNPKSIFHERNIRSLREFGGQSYRIKEENYQALHLKCHVS